MKNIKLNLKKTAKAGFSLVEMLVVIAVIGVIAAIAIPNIGGINEAAAKAKAERQAAASNPTEHPDASDVLMTAWNTAVTHDVVKGDNQRDLTQIVMIVTMAPAKFGISDDQAALLKGSQAKLDDLHIDSDGKLVRIKSAVKPTATIGVGGLKPGKTS